MKRTLQEQIQANKRASLFYAFLLVLILAVLGSAIGMFYAPDTWWAGTLIAVGIALVMVLVTRTSGSQIMLSIAHAREANAREDQILQNVVEEMAIAAGLPMPRIYVIDQGSPNAFATGHDPEHAIIVVTTGLLAKLNRDELQGVIAHEMGHVRNYDIQFMTAIGLLAGLIPLLADFLLRSFWWGGGGRSRSRSRDDGNLGTILMVVGLVLALLAPVFSVLLQMAVSRKREYLADASAAELTRYPEGLASALRKIAGDHEPLTVANRATQHMYIVNPLRAAGDGSSMFSTHPPTEARIAALMGLAGNYPPRPELPKPPIADHPLMPPPIL